MKNKELREKIRKDSWKFREYMECLDSIEAGLSVKIGEVCFEREDGEANLLTDL